MNTPIRILLSEAASKHLTSTGERAFIIIHKVMRGTEEPETAGRWAITLLPCEHSNAAAACRVAMGVSGERKVRTPQRASSTQQTACGQADPDPTPVLRGPATF